VDRHDHDDDGFAVLAGDGRGAGALLFLALYAFGVFGYVTAALATFFVGRDAENDEAELAGGKQLAALRDEVIALREEIRALTRHPPGS